MSADRRVKMPYSKMSAFKGHIFDLDGTLIMSNDVWTDVDLRFLGKRGLSVPEDYSKALSVMNFDQAAIYTKERFGLEDDVEDIKKEWFESARYRYAHTIPLYKGVKEYLEALYSSGKSLALATASSAELYEPVLKRTGVYDMFSVFVTTAEVERGKGFPDVYLEAAKRLGLEPGDCIVYEDIYQGIRAAKGAGFHTAACLNEHYQDDDKMRAESEYIFRQSPAGASSVE